MNQIIRIILKKQDNNSKNNENPFMKYLRKDRLPNIFCAGCGNGIALNTFFLKEWNLQR